MRDVLRDQLDAARRRAGVAGVARVWMWTLVALPAAAASRAPRRDVSSPHEPTHGRPDMFERTMSDMRFAVRLLRKSPIFAVVAVLAISLGAGAVTTIFSAMNAMVLRPVPGSRERLASRRTRVSPARRPRSRSPAHIPPTPICAIILAPRAVSAAWARATLSIAATRPMMARDRDRELRVGELLLGAWHPTRARAILSSRGGSHAAHASGDRRVVRLLVDDAGRRQQCDRQAA